MGGSQLALKGLLLLARLRPTADTRRWVGPNWQQRRCCLCWHPAAAHAMGRSQLATMGLGRSQLASRGLGRSQLATRGLGRSQLIPKGLLLLARLTPRRLLLLLARLTPKTLLLLLAWLTPKGLLMLTLRLKADMHQRAMPQGDWGRCTPITPLLPVQPCCHGRGHRLSQPEEVA